MHNSVISISHFKRRDEHPQHIRLRPAEISMRPMHQENPACHFGYNHPMQLGELARLVNARLAGEQGAETTEVTGVAGIEEAGPGQITFVANPKYASLAHSTRAAAVLVTEDFPAISAATLRTANPYLAFARAIEIFYQPPSYPAGIHPTAVIHATATLGKDCHVGAYVVVEAGVTLGDHAVLLPHTVIYPNVRIGKHFFAHAHAVVREGCQLGDHVTLQNGAVIGADGFGFAKDEENRWYKIPQSGPAILEDAVEVQANACIDRASVGETRIGRGTKIDNLVQVGHGCTVGEDTLLCAQVGLAGSSHLGRNVILAGQSAVAGHCSIGDGAVLTAQSAVSHDVPAGKMMSGSPGLENRLWLRCVTAYSRLPEIVKQLRKLSAEVEATKRRENPHGATDE
jgi:UDP-3-O-[3-hydroxymyristoyl] glucosamine N-acyltransferase